MDYLCIGSNGFAQLGEPDCYMKNKAEMSVLMEYLETNFPIPDEFAGMCFYKVKWFQHDFGSYSEIVLFYDDHLVEQWDISDNDKFIRFWDWFYSVESVNLESYAITEEMESRYAKMTNESDKIPEKYESKAREAAVSKW